ncbi:MAG: hypothetical protein HZC19_04200 [Candidatus Omnitrophica bacterium]|nr:hypothetical protein [Candidatus Omnitrophota bacterium]
MNRILRNEKGIILILGLAFFALFATIVVFSINTVVSGFKLTKRSCDSIKAFYLAEAGSQKALYELRKNYSWTGEGPSSISWNGANKGDYEVSAAIIEGDKRRVLSTGYYPQKSGYSAKRTIEVEIESPMPPWFFDNAITAGDDVDLNGSWTVNGDIMYGDSIDPAGLGQKFDTAFPLLNFSQLWNMAVSQIKPNGQNNLYTQADIDSRKPFPTSFWFDEENNIPNVVYIETNLVLNGNVGTLGGFFVVAGDVVTNPGAEADTTINGNGTIDGVVYTLGDFRINGGGNGLGVTGGVWGRDEVRLNGNATVSYNQDYMNAISGLNIGFKPQIVSWKEIF